jgi:hypothetical protein
VSVPAMRRVLRFVASIALTQTGRTEGKDRLRRGLFGRHLDFLHTSDR